MPFLPIGIPSTAPVIAVDRACFCLGSIVMRKQHFQNVVTALMGNGIVPAAYICAFFHELAFNQNGFSIEHIILLFFAARIFGKYLNTYLTRRCQANFLSVQGYGSVSGLKVDANDKPLSGAVMGLFAASETRFMKDTALLTAVSAEDGRFRFEKIPAGNWLVREIEQPKGFVLSEELFPVTVKNQGQVIEIKIANKLIRGSVTLTKYDADYPENKLSGAVFEVYRDVNGNKALDKDDVLLGTMEESSAGVYWMKDLEYGGVLVREKTAPEGFIPDEKAYYVEIDTDGKTYTVENEAGKGFINRALKGSLKIIKTTSDGKKEGFAFRITGANGYDMTFTTDAKGEIFIEKLRVGEYTVTELKNSASEGYKIADPIKITLVANETLTVKIHNDKTKVDVPKTGDDADLMLWISLLGLAAAGVGCTAFFYLKKRRTGKHIAVKK